MTYITQVKVGLPLFMITSIISLYPEVRKVVGPEVGLALVLVCFYSAYEVCNLVYKGLNLLKSQEEIREALKQTQLNQVESVSHVK